MGGEASAPLFLHPAIRQLANSPQLHGILAPTSLAFHVGTGKVRVRLEGPLQGLAGGRQGFRDRRALEDDGRLREPGARCQGGQQSPNRGHPDY